MKTELDPEEIRSAEIIAGFILILGFPIIVTGIFLKTPLSSGLSISTNE